MELVRYVYFFKCPNVFLKNITKTISLHSLQRLEYIFLLIMKAYPILYNRYLHLELIGNVPLRPRPSGYSSMRTKRSNNSKIAFVVKLCDDDTFSLSKVQGGVLNVGIGRTTFDSGVVAS